MTDLMRKWTLMVGFAILSIFVFSLAWLLIENWSNAFVRQFVIDHFRVIVCLPVAGLFAFVVIAIEQAEGKVEHKLFGLEFKGPGGPITLWILAFLAITRAIYLNWS